MKKLIVIGGIAAAILMETKIIASPQRITEIQYRIQAEEAVTDRTEAQLLAKAIWGEARGVESTTEKAAVCWVILNRVDSDDFPDTVYEVITQYNQFCGYSCENPIIAEYEEIAADVLDRWEAEKSGQADIGRVIPNDYYYFCGNGSGERNNFTRTLNSGLWDWSLESPYSD